MNTLLLGLRVLLFALSTFGYLTVLHKKTKLPVEFLPAIVFCGQICVLFAAGILNLLSLSIWLLFGAGLLLAVLSLRITDCTGIFSARVMCFSRCPVFTFY